MVVTIARSYFFLKELCLCLIANTFHKYLYLKINSLQKKGRQRRLEKEIVLKKFRHTLKILFIKLLTGFVHHNFKTVWEISWKNAGSMHLLQISAQIKVGFRRSTVSDEAKAASRHIINELESCLDKYYFKLYNIKYFLLWVLTPNITPSLYPNLVQCKTIFSIFS